MDKTGAVKILSILRERLANPKPETYYVERGFFPMDPAWEAEATLLAQAAIRHAVKMTDLEFGESLMFPWQTERDQGRFFLAGARIFRTVQYEALALSQETETHKVYRTMRATARKASVIPPRSYRLD